MKRFFYPDSPGNMILRLFLILLLHAIPLLFSPLFAQEEDEPEENLDVFWKWVKWNNPGSFLIDHYIKQAEGLHDLREQEIAKLKTKEEWQARQKWVKDKLNELVGPFPEKTPLNPRITGVIKKEDYRIEKVVFESMPGFYVVGCVFVPEKIKKKAPAILNVIGHSQEGFRGEIYQQVYLNLVKKGFIVLAIDPIGQGEDVQFFDPDIGENGFSSVGYSVVEHCYAGNLNFLSGKTLARYFTWDGIRSIDYLVSRKDVDPERIGVTGFSGGGTVTSYVSALDDRVKVSVPCSWSTACRRHTETKGTQDAETNFVGGLKEGISLEDLIEVRAPKPTLMTFTSRDQYLSIQGAREAYQEAKKVYNVYHEPDNIQFIEDDFKHWMTPKIRQKIYKFFMDHLDVEGDPTEEEVQFLSWDELNVTPTGNVIDWLKGENIQSINAKETAPLLKELEVSRKTIPDHLEKTMKKAPEISGYISPEYGDGDPFFNGRYQRDGYSVSRYAIKGEGKYLIPFLLFKPNTGKPSYPAIIYLHPDGKAAEAAPGGQIEEFVRKGYLVAAVDVVGVGECKNTVTRENADDYTGVLIGRSTPGIQAGDIVRVVNYLRHHAQLDHENIGAVGIDEMGIPLLHATAFEPAIKNLTLVGSLISYRSVVMNDLYKIGLVFNSPGYWHPWEIDFSWGIAGVLTGYDLPDLIGCIAPRKVALAGLKNQLLETATDEAINLDMKFPHSVYKYKNASENIKIEEDVNDLGSLVNWCFK
ncbi:MAG: xylan esterase [Saprospiraceae bacterium]|nr:xylan esterase [Saprospiraceae bacterium]